ncbi:MAG TPA: hypothetical protein PLY87_02360 [Planctomycetaceae bacterium]|nr:hypothetical protein [Planctomycetaceae bacterium]HQZ63885.1 hypothetical protein [Planctomycetaceae bacterium]
MAITPTHFLVLIYLKRKASRRLLAKKAIEQKLSVSDLRRLAQQVKEPREKLGGRKPDILKILNLGRKMGKTSGIDCNRK